MKFYFDDSGSFSVTEAAPHIMLGILFPDNKEEKINTFYKSFVGSLKPTEYRNNEPKGSALSDVSRMSLFKYLSVNPWIRIAVSISDSEFNNKEQIQGYRNEQVQLYEADFKNGLDKKVPKEVVELQKELLEATKGGISDVQFVKGLLLFRTVTALLYNSAIAYEDSSFDSCWDKFEIVFDRQDKIIITPMEKWINREFMHYIQEHPQPLILPESWASREHPFILKFKDAENNRLVLNKIFEDGFKYEDSVGNIGLQFADWISNTLRQVFYRKRDPEYLNILKPNLVGHNSTKINLIHIYKADMLLFTISTKICLINYQVPANQSLKSTL